MLNNGLCASMTMGASGKRHATAVELESCELLTPVATNELNVPEQNVEVAAGTPIN